MLSRSPRPLLTLLFVLHTVLAEPQAPPYIIEGPPDPVIYFSGNKKEEVKLPCQATGNPEISYQWMRNGQTVTSDETVSDKPGMFVLSEPDENDVGLYQCFAENGVGKAMSNKTLVLESSRAHFADEEPVEVRATVGQKLTLECKTTSPSVPTPSLADFWWEKEDTSAARWPLDRRVQIDDMGNLNIAAVQEGDIQDPPLVWQCAIANSIIDVSAKGSRKKIVASGEPDEMPSKPKIMFYTNQTENRDGRSVAVGLEGRPFDLRCFFSGSDDIGIEWDRTDGVSIPSDTSVQKLDQLSRLHFKSLLRSDEGMYNCIGSSHAQPSTRFPIQLHVHAVPTFKLSDDSPINYNATVGENVVFKCNAYAIPEAKVEWYRNGGIIDPENPPSKFHFSPDRRTLTVSSVCKVNCSGDNDLMTIQCNASNEHGYTLGSGFINVFEPTVFIVKPEGITPTFPDPVSFRVKARSDPDTTITYRWYYHDPDSDCEEKWCMVYNVTDKTSVSNENGSVLTILRTEEKDLGSYRCVASNGVKDHSYTVELIEPENLREAYIWPYWWVILLILLLILIVLITVLCCCCWMRRNRGDEYPVDEKERAADRDPEKELMDSGFHDYQRPTQQRGYEDDRRPLTS